MNIKKIIFVLAILISNFACINHVYSAQFKVKDIKVFGLKRVDEGVVLNAMPVGIGETFDTSDTSKYIRSIYKSGHFKSITINRSNNMVYIYVKEKPAISNIKILGNDSLDSELLNKSLSSVDIKVGSSYDEFTVQKVTQELEQQYLNQGKYAVRIKTDVKALDKNRVALVIKISEGKIAKIKQIRIIGNKSFSESTLLSDFNLTEGSFITWFTLSDRYSKQKLASDLEKLKSYYLDRGYLNFKINDVRISLTPDKKEVYITIQIHEGSVYKIGKVAIGGRANLNRPELNKLLKIEPGEIYSSKKIVDSESAILNKLDQEGFLYARVDINKNVNKVNKIVDITFFVKPGNRVYVRRINFIGNIKTQDEVIRRQVLQMEGSVVSKENIELSKQKLYQLGYLKDVNVETLKVPGSFDQVDLRYTFTEANTGHFNGGVGYSEAEGIMFNVGLSQDNFLGSGKNVAIDFTKSPAVLYSNISYFDPFFTIDGIGLGYNIYYSKSKLSELDISSYKLDSFGAALSMRVPLSLYDVLNFSQGVDNKTIKTSNSSAAQITAYVNTYGREHTLYPFSIKWVHNKLDRALFPTSGWSNKMGTIFALPFSDIDYYILHNNTRLYIPLYREFIFYFRGSIAYGSEYNNNKYPFFENFYSGGMGTVRGFTQNSLGPKDSRGDTFGGNASVNGSFELYLPRMFASNAAWRPSLFIDAGNVYKNNIDLDDLRVAGGVGIQWLSPLGPLNVSYALPIRKRKGDDTKSFNFSVGSNF